MNRKINLLLELYKRYSGKGADDIKLLPVSGSNRQYYRIYFDNDSVIGVYNQDRRENNAFLALSRHFMKHGLKVPAILAEDTEKDIYLLQDLGDTTLFSYLSSVRSDHYFPEEIVDLYKKVIEELPRFQIIAGKGLDYSVCYPRHAFDKQSMLWDLSYFKYYFLKLAKIHFDEQALEDDFNVFTDYLLSADCDHFLYRDFQSRNIMLHDDELYFIDYQGGRKGALQYDLASLLYDAKAAIPNRAREELRDYYIEQVTGYTSIELKSFIEHFYGYVLIRIMQALGAYGFRGFYEKKEHFLQSIPYALDNLKYLFQSVTFPFKAPTLLGLLEKITTAEHLYALGKTKLKVTVNSFSYKKGIPADSSGNGGGYVFDCRALPNPGRLSEYADLTGLDDPVIGFLRSKKEVEMFLVNAFALVDQSIKNYLVRDFKNLLVNFGCTGGQHRSVYCAGMLAEYLEEKYDVEVELSHKELDINLKI